MAIEKKKLGRGLADLIGVDLSRNDSDYIKEILIDDIIVGIYQPRSNFDQETLSELADSIKQHGVLQPILVRISENQDGKYELIAGERRLRASKLAGRDMILAKILPINQEKATIIAIIENIQRDDLSVIDRALSYKKLLDIYKTHEQVALITNKSRAEITNILRILSLPDEVQKMLEKKQISYGHARSIISSEDPIAIAKNIVGNNLTVRETEIIVKKSKKPKVKSSEVDNEHVNSSHVDMILYSTKIQQKLAKIFRLKIDNSYNSQKNLGNFVVEYGTIEELRYLMGVIRKFEDKSNN